MKTSKKVKPTPSPLVLQAQAAGAFLDLTALWPFNVGLSFALLWMGIPKQRSED